MAVEEPTREDAITRAELFRACPQQHLARLLYFAEEVRYEIGEVLYEPGAIADSVYVVKTGVVALYVRYHNGTMLTVDILGPNSVTGTSGLFHEGARQLRAMAIMPSILLVLPARQLQGLLLLEAALSGPIYEELSNLLRRRMGHILRAVTAEEAVSPTEQQCPVGRNTRFLASSNVRSGQIMGMCQRQFPCTVAQGNGCPMAGKPAQQFYPLFTSPHWSA